MHPIIQYQQDLAHRIEESSGLTNWRDWKWQLKHSVRTIEKFQSLTGIQFSGQEHELLQKTLEQTELPQLTGSVSVATPRGLRIRRKP